MCQIITYNVKYNEENKKIWQDPLHHINLVEALAEKGGELFSFTAIIRNIKTNGNVKSENTLNNNCEIEKTWPFVMYASNMNEAKDKVKKFYDKVIKICENFDGIETYVQFIFFSRQAPEMEVNEDIHAAPYIIVHNGSKRYVWMHGTVANLEQLEKELDINVTVDSEIFGYYDEIERKKLIIEGVYTAFVYDENEEDDDILYDDKTLSLFTRNYYNGIGLWVYQKPQCDKTTNNVKSELVQIIATTSNKSLISSLFANNISDPVLIDDSKAINDTAYINGEINLHSKSEKSYTYVAFSGGMDIVFSLFDYIAHHDNISAHSAAEAFEMKKNTEFYIPDMVIHLLYFDYGARAREQEIETMNKVVEYINHYFSRLEPDFSKYCTITTEIVDVKPIFTKLAEIGGSMPKLMDKNSQGDISETEANLAYIPYRNTIFAELIGAMIDRDIESNPKNSKNDIDIIFGLNLTEMSVYTDNTAAWANMIQNVINYGGRNYKRVKIVAPFNNMTKTNMLLYMFNKYGPRVVEDLLNIAFSCYYPENGKPCGKCGSCILREKALQRAEKIYRSMLLKDER